MSPVVYETVMSRIRHYRERYRNNEQAVRDHLVNPVLRELGWDPEDPAKVMPNMSTEEGYPDYSLMLDGKPVLFVEAKNLHENVENRKWIDQLMKYAYAQGTQYGLLTNGVVWLLAASFKQGTRPTERIIWKTDLENETWHAIDRKLTLLHRDNIPNLDVVITGTQILDEAWTSLLTESSHLVAALVPVLQEVVRDSYPDSRLSPEQVQDYVEEKIEEVILGPSGEGRTADVESPPSPSRPGETRLTQSMSLQGKAYQLKYVYEILVHTANWLISKGKLRKTDVPVLKTGPIRYLVNYPPQHVYGEEFKTPKQLDNGLFIECHCNQATAIRLAKRLLEYYGYPATTLEIH